MPRWLTVILHPLRPSPDRQTDASVEVQQTIQDTQRERESVERYITWLERALTPPYERGE